MGTDPRLLRDQFGDLRYARNIQWGEVWESVQETPAPMLATGET